MKKQFIPVLLFLVFLASGAFAKPVPSNVAITIDGVRTAFFDEAGNYFSPLEENGIVYVPVLQLAESLGLDVTVDPDKLAVTLNGVRTAFFAEDGSYLPPLNVNGILYAPLDAFIESAGIAVEKEDGKYSFAHSGSASSAATETAAPAPTEEPKQSALADLLTTETWVEVHAPEDRCTFNTDGTCLNEYIQNGKPVSTTYKWEATGDKSFDLINTVFFALRIHYELAEQDGLLLFTSAGTGKFFVRESEYHKAIAVIHTPAPTPTPTPQPSPTPTPDMTEYLARLKTYASRKDIAPASDFIYASNGDEIQINSYIGGGGKVVIPSEIDGLPVTKIKDCAFEKTNVSDIVFPPTLKEIGDSAFYCCYKLTSVVEIPSTIERVGGAVFHGSKAAGFIIDSSFKAIGSFGIFSYASSAEFLYIREGANPDLGNNGFEFNSNLKLAILPASLTTLPQKMFKGANLLKIITPAGSAADKFARANFIPVENDTYAQYVAKYEAKYPNPEKQSTTTIENSSAPGILPYASSFELRKGIHFGATRNEIQSAENLRPLTEGRITSFGDPQYEVVAFGISNSVASYCLDDSGHLAEMGINIIANNQQQYDQYWNSIKDELSAQYGSHLPENLSSPHGQIYDGLVDANKYLKAATEYSEWLVPSSGNWVKIDMIRGSYTIGRLHYFYIWVDYTSFTDKQIPEQLKTTINSADPSNNKMVDNAPFDFYGGVRYGATTDEIRAVLNPTMLTSPSDRVHYGDMQCTGEYLGHDVRVCFVLDSSKTKLSEVAFFFGSDFAKKTNNVYNELMQALTALYGDPLLSDNSSVSHGQITNQLMKKLVTDNALKTFFKDGFGDRQRDEQLTEWLVPIAEGHLKLDLFRSTLSYQGSILSSIGNDEGICGIWLDCLVIPDGKAESKEFQTTSSSKPTLSPKPKSTPTIKPSANQEYRIMLGITISDVTEEISKQYYMPRGVYIAEINPMSAAEQAGLQVGDIITAFAGEKVESADDLNAIKAKQLPNNIVSVDIDRNGRVEALELTIPQPILVETETNPSNNKQEEVLYQRAAELLAAKDIDGAAALYVQIRGYSDVEDILKKNKKLKSAVHVLATAPFQKVGGIVTIGQYEQDNDTANGPEPIEWIVLEAKKNKVLLISRYGLEVKPFHQYRETVTWEQCSLRNWLNDPFFTSVFDDREQKAIATTTVDNSRKQGAFNSNGGKNTKDKLFLLSYAEANKYFGTDKKRLCELTQYVLAKGVSGNGNCYWWLRSPGPEKDDYTGRSKYSQSAELVHTQGKIFNNYVDSENNAVRPALWLDLNSDLF